MSQVLPPLFIVVSALALVLALYAFWQSLRGLWQSSGERNPLPPRSAARMALIDEKASLLQALKDLSFERDMGKISEQDFEAFNARYRGRAKQVLRDLDEQLGPFRKQAETLVAATLKDEQSEATSTVQDAKAVAKASAEQGKGGKSANTGDVAKVAEAPAEHEADASSAPPKEDRVACSQCGVLNELDAAFCKKCGHKMTVEAE